MCKLSDKDLRMAGNRNMTELMWAAVKEPLETHFQFDKEGLDLAFKYFTCSTLTIRLAGIAQINVRRISIGPNTCILIFKKTLVFSQKVFCMLNGKIFLHRYCRRLRLFVSKAVSLFRICCKWMFSWCAFTCICNNVFFYLQNQINLYNESCNNETLMDTERLVCFLKQRI